MDALYNLAVGPLAWAAWTVFIGGSLIRLVLMYQLAKQKDASSLAYMSWSFGLRSIINWLIPFNALGWKKNPLVTVVTFVFHICLLAAPVFLLAHAVLWDQWFGIHIPALDESTGDLMTLAVIAACLVFAARRLAVPEVRFITRPKDWVALIIVLLPFLTGFLAYHQVFHYKTVVTLHILAGELMLAAIPFTRLSHMVFALFTRAYMGSEFGGVRRARDW